MQTAIGEDRARMLELPCTPEAVQQAHRLARDFFGDPAGLAELVAGELATNAWKHASVGGIGRFRIVLYPPGGASGSRPACIAVYDCSVKLPNFSAKLEDMLLEEGGRGLAMLRAMGVDLQVRQPIRGWGKVVLAFLDLGLT